MNVDPFAGKASDYDAWYDRFPNTFRSEVLALRAVLPPSGDWVEVGVGTGRFAHELDIQTGVEPSNSMAQLAQVRGIRVVSGYGEDLPLATASRDAVFFITALCFVEDIAQCLSEAARVLRPGGHCIIGLLPADSALGQAIEASKTDDPFFRHAQLTSVEAVFRHLTNAGFSIDAMQHTLMGHPAQFEDAIQSPHEGAGCGSFVVFRACQR